MNIAHRAPRTAAGFLIAIALAVASTACGVEPTTSPRTGGLIGAARAELVTSPVRGDAAEVRLFVSAGVAFKDAELLVDGRVAASFAAALPAVFALPLGKLTDGVHRLGLVVHTVYGDLESVVRMPVDRRGGLDLVPAPARAGLATRPPPVHLDEGAGLAGRSL